MRKFSGPQRLLAGIAVLATGVLAAEPAFAIPEPSTATEVRSPSISAEQQLASDAAKLAPTTTLTEAQMLARMKDEQAAGTLIESVRVLAGARFSGAWADVAGPWQVHIRLTTGSAIASVDAVVAKSGLPVSLTYDGALSEQALVDAATAVAAQFTGSGEGVDGVYVDINAAELVVVANPSASDTTRTLLDGARAAQSGVLTEAAQGRAAAATESIPVRVEASSGAAGDHNRGGVAMNGCTAGFTVQGSSASGLVTAGHCADSQTYFTTPTGAPTYSAPFIASSQTASADLQWNTTPSHTDYAAFYGSSATASTSRSGTGVAYSGQGLCHRGRTTGYTCGYVTSTTYAPTWSGACPSTCSASFVRVDGSALAERGGDSGGPWFSGGAAYGIHKGGIEADVAGWSVFTPIARLSNLGVSLL